MLAVFFSVDWNRIIAVININCVYINHIYFSTQRNEEESVIAYPFKLKEQIV